MGEQDFSSSSVRGVYTGRGVNGVTTTSIAVIAISGFSENDLLRWRVF